MANTGVSFRFRALTKKPIRLIYEDSFAKIDKFVIDYLNGIRDKVQPYPPVPGPPNRYKRTNDLYNSWTITDNKAAPGTGIDRYITVGNANAKYARFVHGAAGYQRPYHAARGWRRLEDYLDRPGYNSGIRAFMRDIRMTESY